MNWRLENYNSPEWKGTIYRTLLWNYYIYRNSGEVVLLYTIRMNPVMAVFLRSPQR